jgi:Zn-dependent protease with chaperone function
MIYTNFLLFIAALFMFATAPLATGSSGAVPHSFKLYGIVLILLVFWQFNRYKFMKLRAALVSDLITINEGKKRYASTTTIHLILALFAFAAEIFLFDLKYFLVQIPFFGNLETSVNIAGLAVFILHLSIVWYWSFRAMGDIIFIGKSAADHVKANIKFNLVIVVPWLCLSLLMDVILTLSTPSLIQWISSPLVQVVVFGLFLVGLAVVAPAFIVWIWDCKPLEDPELKNTINTFCRSRGVKFKDIMSWNALNGGLVTAGVLGLVTRFRYLLITPELIKLLDKDELLGVVSHEIGHVKKNHLRYYLAFFLGFMLIVTGILQLTSNLVSVSPLGWYITLQDGEFVINSSPMDYITFFILLFLFILYFRFIFGYFMRNFEREADIFCFHAGVNPDLLVSSFHKLEEHMGGEEKKSNWHHYTISQRVGFLRTCMENPQHVAAHEKKVKRSIRVFMAAMIIVVMLSSYMFIAYPTAALDIGTLKIEALKREVEKNSNDPILYFALGLLYYQKEKWEEAKEAYENSIQLKYRQPEVLNSLAWLLLKCPDEKLLDPKRALELAEDAVDLNENSFHSLDTLAEAYFQNSRYKEAFYAARRAYLLATENRDYYEKQLKKMAKYYKTFKSAITI